MTVTGSPGHTCGSGFPSWVCVVQYYAVSSLCHFKLSNCQEIRRRGADNYNICFYILHCHFFFNLGCDANFISWLSPKPNCLYNEQSKQLFDIPKCTNSCVGLKARSPAVCLTFLLSPCKYSVRPNKTYVFALMRAVYCGLSKQFPTSDMWHNGCICGREFLLAVKDVL